jgi:hypothetical protein
VLVLIRILMIELCSHFVNHMTFHEVIDDYSLMNGIYIYINIHITSNVHMSVIEHIPFNDVLKGDDSKSDFRETSGE